LGHVHATNGLIAALQLKFDTNRYGDSALLLACARGHLDFVQRLKTFAWPVPRYNNEKRTALHVACDHGHLHIVRWLVEDGFFHPKEERDTDGTCALMLASGGGHLDVVSWLVTVAGCSAKKWDYCGRTAFLYACGEGRLDVARWLVTNAGSCAKSERDIRNMTALLLACSNGHLDVARWLVTSAGSCAKTERDVRHMTALLHASAEGRLDVARWLVTHAGSCTKTERDVKGMTALLHACCNGRLDVARWLVLDMGCDVLETARKGFGPLHFARENQRWAVCQWLIQDVDVQPVRDHRRKRLLLFCFKSSRSGVSVVQTKRDLTFQPIAQAAARAVRFCVHFYLRTNWFYFAWRTVVLLQVVFRQRWQRLRVDWLRAMVNLSRGAASATHALLCDTRMRGCDDGMGKPLRYLSWYGGRVATML
jgi:ankyrin repeat protein